MTQSIDWPRLLGDIAYLIGEQDFAFPEVRVAVGTQRLATYLELSRGAVRNYLDGTEPRHSEGERLITVWVKLSGKPREFAPRERASMSAASARRAVA
jgi:hypothetical protein